MNLNYHLYTTLPLYILICTGLFGLFKKAGQSPWKAFVPILNTLIWLEITGRKKWWLILLFIPLVNFVIGLIMLLDLARAFGRSKTTHQFLALFFPFIFFPFLAFNKTDNYKGRIPSSQEKKISRGFAYSAIAVCCFIFLRTFMFEPFLIPTTSMEGSLKPGDFLIVSKFHYGIRLPRILLSLPLVHNKMPILGTKSYSELINLPYSRLPAFHQIERNDLVVFNYPANDIKPDFGEDFTVKPPSLKQHFIKRCVALPGDIFEIRNRRIFINEKPGWNSEGVQHRYEVTTQEQLSPKVMMEKGFRWINQTVKNPQGNIIQVPHFNNNVRPMQDPKTHLTQHPWHYMVDMPAARAVELRMWPTVSSVKNDEILRYPPEDIFPQDLENFQFGLHNYGPISIPKRGETVKLSPNNIALYKRIIDVYEGHELIVQGQNILIDGKAASDYTFEMDYYWMMGDNRDASFDSRFWGFVPEDHIAGRPVMILFSIEGVTFRLERFFKSITHWEE